MAAPVASDPSNYQKERRDTTDPVEQEFVRAIAEISPAMLWMGDHEGKCIFLNAALRTFWGVNPANLAEFDWNSTTHPDDVARLAGPFIKAMAEQMPFTVEARYKRADGVYRTMRTLANPRFHASGQFLGMTGVNIDITEQLAAEEHTRLLMAELNHRTKNILSVVQAIARKTALHSSPGTFIRSFEERLMALSASNDLLLRTDWSGIQLGELVAAQLAHLADLAGERLTTGGDAIRISSGEVQALSMALHELSTNCLKHGAFSGERGRVQVTWGWKDDRSWQMEWKEATPVPPRPPRAKGFGQTVIVEMVSKALGAEVEVDFPPSGFVWRMTAPRSQ